MQWSRFDCRDKILKGDVWIDSRMLPDLAVVQDPVGTWATDAQRLRGALETLATELSEADIGWQSADPTELYNRLCELVPEPIAAWPGCGYSDAGPAEEVERLHRLLAAWDRQRSGPGSLPYEELRRREAR